MKKVSKIKGSLGGNTSIGLISEQSFTDIPNEQASTEKKRVNLTDRNTWQMSKGQYGPKIDKPKQFKINLVRDSSPLKTISDCHDKFNYSTNSFRRQEQSNNQSSIDKSLYLTNAKEYNSVNLANNMSSHQQLPQSQAKIKQPKQGLKNIQGQLLFYTQRFQDQSED